MVNLAKLESWLCEQPASARVTVDAEKLGLTLEAFHALGQTLELAGEVRGYRVVTVHRESHSGARRIDFVVLEKRPAP
jgi:hypothetical protein